MDDNVVTFELVEAKFLAGKIVVHIFVLRGTLRGQPRLTPRGCHVKHIVV